ncbi:hypothetical protein [Tindallia californiensis]|uniref:Uncharacterized protein n=1 Tax=Tindallia californiensis TaxID=159292 RepID=A0A1H3QPE6_9FIRM|nr:hypothetical protein [Tindallia californiensis]SDZ15286.1 hypothetical protein SAMN05192546_11036 [Tindallia californiensis]
MTKRKAIAIGLVVLTFMLLHSTPALALRTSILFYGHPIVALTTEIQEYEPYSQDDKELLEKENAKFYRVTPAPVEKATQGHLYTWKVRKNIFIYFADYHGEG